jgi:hypothetical protein
MLKYLKQVQADLAVSTVKLGYNELYGTMQIWTL